MITTTTWRAAIAVAAVLAVGAANAQSPMGAPASSLRAGQGVAPGNGTSTAPASASPRTPSAQHVTAATPRIDPAGIRTVQWSNTSAGRIQAGSKAAIDGRGFGATPGGASVAVVLSAPHLPNQPAAEQLMPIPVDIASWSDGRIQLVVRSAPQVLYMSTDHSRISIVTSSGARYER